MPRNGSGTFNPYTPGNPVVANTTIDPVAFNNTINDIASGLTGSVPRDGEAPPTANLPMGNFKFTGLGAGTASGDSLAFGQSLGTGAIVFGAGSAAAPSVTNSTGNTGAYWPTTTSFGIATAGVNAITVDASQNVGIGLGPASKFSVQSAGSATATITNLSALVGSMHLQGTLANTCEDGITYSSGGAGGAAVTFARDANFGTSVNFYTNPTGNLVTGAMTRVGFFAPTGVLTLAAGASITGGTTTDTLAITAGAIISGTYTPTLFNTLNVAASSAFACQYMRVGNVVTVSGAANIDPTSAATGTILGISLPIASTLSGGSQCSGTGASGSLNPTATGCISADTTNHRAQISFIPTSAALDEWFFTFTYVIV